jgi:hypothetical protein
MSPWEIIGWTIAIPMVLFTGLVVFASVVAVVKQIAKPQKPTANKPKRHLRLVEDE